MWLVDRKDIEKEEEIEGASYNTQRNLWYYIVMYVTIDWFKEHLLQKK